MAWETHQSTQDATFVGWGTKKGQHVTGKVLLFHETRGKDFDGEPCPLLKVELTSKAASFNKEGQRTNIDSGEVVLLTCGQPGLRDDIVEVGPKRGDLIKITLDGERATKNGKMKVFVIQIDRSASSSSNGDQSSSDDGGFDDQGGDDNEPPF